MILNDTRPAAVAGTFYSDKPSELKQDIERLLECNPASHKIRPKALICPHAGYVYSGPIAAKAYNLLRPFAQNIKRVVLLGPAHRVALRGIALSSALFFDTPLGRIKVDHDADQKLANHKELTQNDEAHKLEHSLEVQLPFLQILLADFCLVPLVVGQCDANIVSAVLNDIWGDEDTLIIISTDLSHFLPYAAAQQTDQETSQAILAFSDKLSGDQACGVYPLNGLSRIARQRNMTINLVDLRNSGDTVGDKQQVVGYGSFALY